jgi:hypothetical protein
MVYNALINHLIKDEVLMKILQTTTAAIGITMLVTGVAVACKNNITPDESGPSTIETASVEKVTICHRTDSVTNPYVQISVDSHALKGHDKHTGPVATSQSVAQGLKDNDEKWGDIIPNKLNWDTDGQAIYNNDCQYIQTDDTPSPTPAPDTPTPTPTPPVSTTNTTDTSNTPKDFYQAPVPVSGFEGK